MAIRRRRIARKPKRRAAAKRPMRKRASKGVSSVDYAKCVEITESPMLANCLTGGNSVGDYITFCLQDYQRAQEIAHAYKYYRASKVEITFIPYYNVSQTGGGPNTQLPQLYMAVDRLANREIAPTESECLERGISPRLFNKKMRLTFKPNLLQGISLESNQPADGGGQPLGINVLGFQNSVPLFSKWLPTQQSFGYTEIAGGLTQTGQTIAPNGVNTYALKYYGAIFNPSVEGQTPGTQFACGDYHVKITWEFKGPRALKTLRPTPELNPYVATSTQGSANAVPNTQPTTYP